MLPLYPELVSVAGSPETPESANAGLVHQKYPDSWTAAWRKHDDRSWKAFLNRVRALPPAATELLKEYHERRSALARHTRAQAWRGTSLSRVVAGMGGANAREIGFS